MQQGSHRRGQEIAEFNVAGHGTRLVIANRAAWPLCWAGAAVGGSMCAHGQLSSCRRAVPNVINRRGSNSDFQEKDTASFEHSFEGGPGSEHPVAARSW